MSELPEVLVIIGPAALPALAAYIADVSHSDTARNCIISGIEKLASQQPETRSECIALLTKQLELFTENGPDINASLILGLATLKAVEAAPLIERAFAANAVDIYLMGDWEDVQVELGLLSAEELEQRRSKILPKTPVPTLTHEMSYPSRSSKEHRQREAAHQKSKSKMAKQSRKR